MGRIHLLKDSIINKIAAGEVVERPASVLKELLENSIDAGATKITVDLKDGGKSRITVKDNGHGMDLEDCCLATKRHATSKIQDVDDLFHVNSMGFRGEALASINSVSKLSFCTRSSEAAEGFKIHMEHEEFKDPISWQGPQGTSITVEDLFYNVPARAKFLKSETTELAHCMELIQRIAMAMPNVGLELINNGKQRFHAPAYSGETKNLSDKFGEKCLRNRASILWDNDIVSQLVYGSDENKFGAFEGLFSPPGLEKATSKNILSFVNKRWVKDKTIRYGILRGYQSHLLKGRYPLSIGFFSCDPSLVDVNVHPAKTELRFQYAGEVQSLISLTIRKTIREGSWAAPESPDEISLSQENSILSRNAEPLGERSNFLRSPTNFAENSVAPKASWQISNSRPSLGNTGAKKDNSFSESNNRESQNRPKPTPTLNQGIPWDHLKYIGSFQKCYLLFEGEQNLLAVDQHAFHERILFEKLQNDKSLLLESQRLLVPEIIDITAETAEFLGDHSEILKDAGFHMIVVDHHSLEVRAVPSLLVGKSLDHIFAELAKIEQNFTDPIEIPQILSEHLLATIACHAALRAGEDLEETEINSLIAEAKTVDFYHNCPHGRRVFKWFSKHNVEQWFDRI